MAAVLWDPEPSGARGPKPTLRRAEVVEAAIGIADAHGLAAASLRAIAERLGVSITGLYRYVPGKTELIALMVEQALGEDGPGDDDASPTWCRRLEELATQDWQLYHRHPWLLDVPMGQVPPGPSTVSRFDVRLGAALQSGLDPAPALAVVTAIDHLVIGAARDSLEQLAFARASDMSPLQWWRMHGDLAIGRRIADGDYPELARVLAADGFDQGDGADRGAAMPDEGTDDSAVFLPGFRESLSLLLDGVALRV